MAAALDFWTVPDCLSSTGADTDRVAGLLVADTAGCLGGGPFPFDRNEIFCWSCLGAGKVDAINSSWVESEKGVWILR